jgi:hypothetical protein
MLLEWLLAVKGRRKEGRRSGDRWEQEDDGTGSGPKQDRMLTHESRAASKVNRGFPAQESFQSLR